MPSEDDMSDNEESTTPDWMRTQASKADVNGSAVVKVRKPRRTKAQMLADASSRGDAEVTVSVQPKGCTPSVEAPVTLMPPKPYSMTAHLPLAFGMLALLMAIVALLLAR
jgi:hypothetical protein